MDGEEPVSSDRIAIGRIAKTQGRKGEVFARLLTDFPHRFEDVEVVFLQNPEGVVGTFAVENTWLHKGGVVLKLRGIESIDAAERHVGDWVQVDRTQLVPLPAETYYWFELEGCEAVDESGSLIGSVDAIADHGGNTLLVVKTVEGNELLVPTAKEYLVEVDVAQKRIVLRIPRELAQLNS